MTAVFAEGVNGNPRMSGVRTLSQKLIWDEKRGELQLYDLASDPEECRNLSAEDRASVARLESYLESQRSRNAARGVLTPETMSIDGELEKQLKALGYVQ